MPWEDDEDACSFSLFPTCNERGWGWGGVVPQQVGQAAKLAPTQPYSEQMVVSFWVPLDQGTSPGACLGSPGFSPSPLLVHY